MAGSGGILIVPVSMFAMLTALVAIIALTAAWVFYTKNDSEENIKRSASIFASAIFWGVCILIVAVTIIWGR